MAGTQRLELTASGRLHVASQWLASAGYVVTELAPRFGGGYLFERRGDETLIEHAPTYLGQLKPIARLSLPVADLVQGFDRFYAVVDRSRSIVSLDPRGQGVVSPGPLPEAPAYGALAFADAWMGVVTVPYQGTLATFDAGASWRRLGVSDVRSARVTDAGIELSHGSGSSTLRLDGTLRPVQPTGTPAKTTSQSEKVSDGGGAPPVGDVTQLGNVWRSVLARRVGERLVNAALRGWPLVGGHALVIEEGDLLRIDLGTAEELERRTRVVPVNATCHAAPLFSGAGFVCHTARESLLYEAFVHPIHARLVHRFAVPRRVSAAGSGGAVASGPCRGTPRARDSHLWCVVPKTEAPWPISLERFRRTSRVAALASGHAAIITPPDDAQQGSLVVVSRTGTVLSRTPLKVGTHGTNGSTGAVTRGLWLDGITELDDGSLSSWIATDDALVGGLVHPDGSVETGGPHATVAGTLFTAHRALALGSEGQGWQTRDGGQTWRSVPLPKLNDADDGAPDPTLGARGCGLVGCVADGWVRLGWNVLKASNDLPVADPLPYTPLPPAGGRRWLLDCANPRHFPTAARAAGATSDWPGLLGVRAPATRQGEVRHHHVSQSGFTTIHGYAWGPGGGPWHQNGRWVVRVHSGYDAPGDAWSTATTVCPWPDEPSTAAALGRERSAGPALVWSAHFDPDGRGGLLRIGSAVEAETYLVEPNRPLRRIRGEPMTTSSALRGAVRSGGIWFALSAAGSGTLTLARLGSGVAREVMRLRDDSGVTVPTLVRNRDETALGLWVQDAKTRGAATRWFVYPIDATRGEVGAALVVDDDTLGSAPRSCTEEDAGWVLEGRLPLDPALDLGGTEPRPPVSNSVRARVVVGQHGLCVEGLMGVTSETLPPNPWSASGATWRAKKPTAIPFVLRDDDGGGDHWVFECLH